MEAINGLFYILTIITPILSEASVIQNSKDRDPEDQKAYRLAESALNSLNLGGNLLIGSADGIVVVGSVSSDSKISQIDAAVKQLPGVTSYKLRIDSKNQIPDLSLDRKIMERMRSIAEASPVPGANDRVEFLVFDRNLYFSGQITESEADLLYQLFLQDPVAKNLQSSELFYAPGHKNPSGVAGSSNCKIYLGKEIDPNLIRIKSSPQCRNGKGEGIGEVSFVQGKHSVSFVGQFKNGMPSQGKTTLDESGASITGGLKHGYPDGWTTYEDNGSVAKVSFVDGAIKEKQIVSRRHGEEEESNTSSNSENDGSNAVWGAIIQAAGNAISSQGGGNYATGQAIGNIGRNLSGDQSLNYSGASPSNGTQASKNDTNKKYMDPINTSCLSIGPPTETRGQSRIINNCGFDVSIVVCYKNLPSQNTLSCAPGNGITNKINPEGRGYTKAIIDAKEPYALIACKHSVGPYYYFAELTSGGSNPSGRCSAFKAAP